MNVEKSLSEKNLGKIKIIKKNKENKHCFITGKMDSQGGKGQHEVCVWRGHSSLFIYFCFRMLCGMCMKSLGIGIDGRFVSEFLMPPLLKKNDWLINRSNF